MHIEDSGLIRCDKAMEKDTLLLHTLSDEPILHLYEMEGKAATFGHFTRPEAFLDLQACEKEGLYLAKRPTGGGILFHFLDLPFSFLVPKRHSLFSENTLVNYHRINTIVLKAITPLLPGKNFSFLEKGEERISSFCMAHPTPYDLLCEGKKIAGAAQRKTHRGLLHQGSIAILAPPIDLIKKFLNSRSKIGDQIEINSFFFTRNENNFLTIKQTLKDSLLHTMRQFS